MQEVPHFPVDVVVFEDECKSLSVDTGVGYGVVDEAAIAGQPFLSTTKHSPRSHCLRRVSIQKPASRISQLSRRENGSIFLNTNL